MNRWIAAIRGATVFVAIVFTAHAASAQNAGIQAEGAQAVAAWVAAVSSGDKDTVAAILAPEFQILRDNGVTYDRDGYLASNLPKIDAPLQVDELFATGGGDAMVVRYVLVGRLTVDGAEVAAEAPRLTTFRRDGDKWMVASHANFAHIAR
jgi:ketosteroid isomerase-like protein